MEKKEKANQDKHSHWDKLKSLNFPQMMKKIEPEYKVWCTTAQYRNDDSIWGQLAKVSLRSNDFLDRLWLYTWWKRNKEVHDTFLLDNTNVENLPNCPIMTSSPKPDRKSFCICQVSLELDDPTMVECMICCNKFHCACLRIDSRKVKSKIRCPKCTSRPNKKTVDVPSFIKNPSTQPALGNFDVSSISIEDEIECFLPSSHETVPDQEKENEEDSNSENDGSVVYTQCQSSFSTPIVILVSDPSENVKSSVHEDGQELEISKEKNHLDTFFWRDLTSHENTMKPEDQDSSQNTNEEKNNAVDYLEQNASISRSISPTLSFENHENNVVNSFGLDLSGDKANNVQDSSLNKFDDFSGTGGKGKEAKNSDDGEMDTNLPRNSPAQSHSDSNDFMPSKKKKKITSPVSKKTNGDEEDSETIPKEFTLEIPYKKWKRFIAYSEPVENSGSEKIKTSKLMNGWTNLVRKYFKKVNPYCVLNFKRHHFNHQPSSRDKRFSLHTYFHASGNCKHADCFQFKFRSKNQPDKKSNVIFSVSSIGEFIHHDGDMFSNQIRYDERDKIKKQLKHRRAAAVGTDLNQKANMAAVRLGNYTSVPDRHVLRQARYEVLQKDALATDVFEDLRLKVAIEQEGEKEDRFIRHLSVKPCVVVYFSQRQLKLMKLVKDETGELVGHLDSTGSLFKKLPKYCGKKKPLMYSMVINNPARGCPPLPVLEFVINKHTAKAINQPLEIHKEKFQKILGISKRENLFSRIETDFSIAMIEAALQVYAGVGIKEYLNKCWNVLFLEERPFRTNFHVCRSHVSRAVMEQARESYGKDDPRVSTIKSILIGFWKSHQFGSVYYRTRNLFILCGSEFLTPSVERIIVNCEERTPPEVQESKDIWETFEVEGATMKNIYKFTAFGMFFHDLWSKVEIEATEEANGIISKKNCAENPYYNIEFIKYLLRQILPYTPLLTHVMFSSAGDWRKQDHQAAVEIYNRIVKQDEHGKEHRLKLGIFVTKVKKMMLGRCNAFETDWLRNKPNGKKFRVLKTLGSDKRSQSKIEKVEKEKDGHLTKIPETKQINSVEKQATNDDPKSKLGDTFNEKSIEQFQETWKKRGEQVAVRTNYLNFFKELAFIPWGDKVKEESNYTFTNTCTLDNSLMTIYALFNWFPAIKLYFSSEKEKGCKVASSLVNIVNLVHNEKFNTAKATWLKELKRLKVSSSDSNDIFGSEEEISLNALRPILEKFISIQRCLNPAHGTINQHRSCASDIDGSTILEKVHKINNQIVLRGVKCVFDDCQEKIVQDIIGTLENGLPFVVFISHAENSVFELPSTISIKGTNYDLFSVSLNQTHRNHFVAVYPIGQQWYLYDGMWQTKEDGHGEFQMGLPEKYATVNLVWYVKQ